MMIDCCSLLIRHLPPDFTNEEKEEFLKHFGAVHVKCIFSKTKKYNVVFARFNSEQEAKVALHRLHQLDVLGYPLTVEFARGYQKNAHTSEKPPVIQIHKENKDNTEKHYEAFLQKLNAWNSSVNFMQPPPSHLRYQYPPPSVAILTNIARALASVPKLYTQVLHLMNRMNLPSPFENIFPESEVSVNLSHLFGIEENKNSPIREVRDEDVDISEDESEIESDQENKVEKELVPLKRHLSQNNKIIKRPKFCKPMTTSLTVKQGPKPEEIFEKIDREIPHRKIELKLLSVTGETTNIPDAENSVGTAGGFGLMFPENKVSAEEDKNDSGDDVGDGSTITAEELAANRLSSRDQKHLPVFKNYQPGIPSCRLYVKNISKSVVERDLHFIFRRYMLQSDDDQGNMFDIRLMKEGRMKGQAFITLQNVKQAQLALKETNGYILRDKPLVVQFARSALSKDKSQ